jgi:hypothetical protein
LTSRKERERKETITETNDIITDDDLSMAIFFLQQKHTTPRVRVSSPTQQLRGRRLQILCMETKSPEEAVVESRSGRLCLFGSRWEATFSGHIGDTSVSLQDCSSSRSTKYKLPPLQRPDSLAKVIPSHRADGYPFEILPVALGLHQHYAVPPALVVVGTA